MIAFLEQIFTSLLFFVNHIFEMIRFIPRMLGMLLESIALMNTAVTLAPAFLMPILVMILAVAVVMWLVNLL